MSTFAAEECNRRSLVAAVATICQENNIERAENDALSYLTEMLEAFLTELGRNARNFADHAGRARVLADDIIIALCDMGQPIQGITSYAKRENRRTISDPLVQKTPTHHRNLSVGTKQTLPAYVPDYLPNFPDQHTYMRTNTYNKPRESYEQVRNMSANQINAAQLAITRLIASTSATQPLFHTNTNIFQLIEPSPKPHAYLTALLTDCSSDDESNTHSKPVFSRDAENVYLRPPRKQGRKR